MSRTNTVLTNTVLVTRSHRRGRALEAFLKATAAMHLRGLELTGCELSVALVSDAEIQTLNRQWRRKDKATDVLSFPLDAPPVPGRRQLLGDIIVSLDTAERQARERGGGLPALKAELARYLAHGLLHLLGHDHHRAEPRRKMAALEAKLLGEPGLIPAGRLGLPGAGSGARPDRSRRGPRSALGARRSVAR